MKLGETLFDVKAEGTQFRFCCAPNEVLKNELDLQDLVPADLQNLVSGTDTRLVFFENMLKPGSWLTYWLVWQDGRDLKIVDDHVRRGLASDQDFFCSFKTHALVVKCPHCLHTFKALAVDAGDPYPGAKGLLQEKITSRFRILACPNCRSSCRLLIAKIIESSEAEAPAHNAGSETKASQPIPCSGIAKPGGGPRSTISRE